MATTRLNLEKIFEILRKKVTKEDLDWLKNKNPKGYKGYVEEIEKKRDIACINNTMTLALNIQCLIDAITREVNNSYYQYADIPKCYVVKLAIILKMPIPKKFKKGEMISSILEINKNKNTV